jgi:hypothetical protein
VSDRENHCSCFDCSVLDEPERCRAKKSHPVRWQERLPELVEAWLRANPGLDCLDARDLVHDFALPCASHEDLADLAETILDQVRARRACGSCGLGDAEEGCSMCRGDGFVREVKLARVVRYAVQRCSLVSHLVCAWCEEEVDHYDAECGACGCGLIESLESQLRRSLVAAE